jgi:DNA polymerase I-like protein with 3'-5' exonuclease and polymerase domains
VILAEPGPCALDFESYPTSPGWHATQAATAAPRGQKGAARARAQQVALLNNRAHLRRPCILSLCHSSGAEVVVRLAVDDDPAPRRVQLQAMFAECRASLVAHRAQFECELLLSHGVPLDIDCTLLMAKALLLVAYDPEKQAPPVEFGLAALVERESGRVRDKAVRDRDWRDPESLDAAAIDYCRQDARDALELYRLYQARLEEQGLFDGYRLIQQAILPTAAINLVGMEFDATAHAALIAHLRNRADRLKRLLDQICDGAVRNHGSTPQVGDWIMDQVLAGDFAGDHDRLANFGARLCAVVGVTWKHTKSRRLVIDKGIKARQARTLQLHYPTIARYLRAHALWTQVTKLAGSFGETLTQWVDVDGRLRGQLTAGATVTLRHNAQHPPVQEMPRRKSFRRLFRAPRGRRLVDCDYSQIELRLAAVIAKDEALLEVYRQGLDVHKEVAGHVDLPRSQAKPVSFTMIYAGGAAKIADSAGVSPEKAQAVLEGFLKAYPGIAAYRERAPREAEQAGFIAIRPGRRVRYDPAISKPPQAVNYPIQGGAASVQMRALRRVYDVLVAQPWLGARLVGAIHDELILESPDDERAGIAAGILQHEMRTALLEVFPEAAAMGADRLAAAAICTSWADKP